MTQSFASGIPATNGVAQPSTCDTNTLETSTGPAKLRAEFTPEIINLKWYNDDTRINVPTSSNTCTYGTAISLPQNPTKPGYKFAGWEITSALPSGYTELKYIEGGTDHDAYIDLGFPATPTMQTLLTASIGEENNEQVLFGASDALAFSGGKPYAIDRTSTSVLIPNGDYNSNTSRISFSTQLNTIYQFKINYPAIGTIGFNDITKTAFTNISSVASNNLWLFWYHGTSSPNNRRASVRKMKFYNLKMWDNNVKIHDFIPAKNSNNVIGIYDMVTGAFLTNAGTGNFIAGPEI